MRKKKSKCPKKNFQSVERGKNVSVEFRVFGKKKELKEKFREKKSKCFGVEILLSSCSLVDLEVKVMGENDENFQSIFRVGVVPYTRWGAML